MYNRFSNSVFKHYINNIYSYLVLCLFLTSTLQAQETLKGVIYEAGSEEILPFVDIYLIGTAQGTQSDFDGTFSLALANEVDSVGVAMIGYQKQAFAIKDIQDFDNFIVCAWLN